MDETANWTDMPGNTSIDSRGVKSVPILTTGHEKYRATVCLTAMADGCKLSSLIVFKGKRIPSELTQVRGVHVEFTGNGWMLPPTTEFWIKRV